MPREVHDRQEVRALIEGGAQVVDVLGAEDFEEDHLPGAMLLTAVLGALSRTMREAS